MALSESFFVRIKHALPFAINSHRQRMLQKKKSREKENNIHCGLTYQRRHFNENHSCGIFARYSKILFLVDRGSLSEFIETTSFVLMKLFSVHAQYVSLVLRDVQKVIITWTSISWAEAKDDDKIKRREKLFRDVESKTSFSFTIGCRCWCLRAGNLCYS